MIKQIWIALTKKEQRVFLIATAFCVASSVAAAAIAMNKNSVFIPVAGGILREGEVGQPVAINPVISGNPVDLDISALVYGKVGDILTSHETTGDSKVHTIKIREGVTWSNDRPLTSDDIVFTIRRIQDPEAKSPLFKKWAGIVVERVSELQVRLTLQNPYAFFPEMIRTLPIIPEHVFGKIPSANLKLSDYNLAPVGSGPYKLKNLVKRKDGFIKEIRLIRNALYPLEPAFIDEIIFVFFENEESRVQALKKRQIDAIGSGNPLLGIEKEGSNIKTDILPFSRVYGIFMNENINPLLKNKTTRQALRDALDKKEMTRALFGEEIGSPLEGPMVGLPENALQNKLSKEEIASHLAQRKKAEGELVLNLMVPDVEFLKRTARIVKESWESAGVDSVNLIVLPSEDILENVIKPGNYEMLLFGTIAETPEDIFPFWHSSERYYPGLNLSLYKNTRADALMERIRKTEDPEERGALGEELDAVIRNDIPAIFLYTLPYVHVHIKKLREVAPQNPYISSPSERFENVAKWYVKQARVVNPAPLLPKTSK
ncbi:MAG: ABC transporter substrate-binding protein [Nanoarchaeota archaeon]|nr:ABC transporter substrate-binding protein [Nanoarchaeota archaeon]